MAFEELDQKSPNGFVDVEVTNLAIDYRSTAELIRFRRTASGDTVAVVRMLDELKGAGGAGAWHAGELRTVSLVSDAACAPEKFSPGIRLIFFGGFDRSSDRSMSASAPWLVMPPTAGSFAAFRRGVAQDYAATAQNPGGN